MRLLSRATVDVVLIDPIDVDRIARSQVILHGIKTGNFVPGAQLEAAIALDDRYLLFLTDDVLFEDALHVCLLKNSGDVVDNFTLGGPYATGFFRDLQWREPDTVEFKFLGEFIWSVKVLNKAAPRFPFFSDPPGVKRRSRLISYFVIKKRPFDF